MPIVVMSTRCHWWAGQDVFEHDVDHFRRKDREVGGHYLENEECNPIQEEIYT